MTLALRLGRTLHEIRETLTASELKMWLAYNEVSPIGDWRGDVQAAQIATATINSQGGKVTMDDVLLRWERSEEEDEVSGLETWMSGL